MTKTLIAKKHAAAISVLFNTIRANEVMQRSILEDQANGIGLGDRLSFGYWHDSSLDAGV